VRGKLSALVEQLATSSASTPASSGELST
jgi:hypothetical protein